jgi:hypothetical protein
VSGKVTKLRELCGIEADESVRIEGRRGVEES